MPSTDPTIAVTLYPTYEWGCEWSFDLTGLTAGQEVIVYADEDGVPFDPDWGHDVEPITVVIDADGAHHFPRDSYTVGLDAYTSYIFTVSQGETIIARTTVTCEFDGSQYKWT